MSALENYFLNSLVTTFSGKCFLIRRLVMLGWSMIIEFSSGLVSSSGFIGAITINYYHKSIYHGEACLCFEIGPKIKDQRIHPAHPVAQTHLCPSRLDFPLQLRILIQIQRIASIGRQLGLVLGSRGGIGQD